MKPHIWLIRTLSHIVPKRWREDWQQEWEAELQHRESLGRAGVFRRSLGSFWDALAMQPRRLEEEVFQDLRFGIRMFAKDKALTFTAILSLALGIGANTALFSMIDTVLLKKLPVKNPDELVLFEWKGNANGLFNGLTSDRNIQFGSESGVGDTFSHPAFEEFRRNNTSLADVFAFAKPYNVSLLVDDRAEIGTGQWVSGGFFSGLSVSAALGRTITHSDDTASSAPVAVISHRYWQRRFALDPGVLGKIIRINNAPFTIVGVSASDFAGTLQVNDSPDVFIPLSAEPVVMGDGIGLGPKGSNPNMWWVYIMGRTKRGVSLDQARANLQFVFDQTNSVAAATVRRPPNGNVRPRTPLRLDFSSGSRGLVDNRERFQQPLLILLVLAAIVLLVACVNVANLLLSRASNRQQEIAVRLALGAGRLRILRQVLTESVLLAACGGLCATVLAYFTKDLFLKWGPWSGPTTTILLKLDWRALSYAVLVSVLTGIAFGLAPAFASMRNLNSTMQKTSRRITHRSYAGKILLVTQIGLSVVLLIGAGLFVGTMRNFHNVISEYDPEHLLQFDIDPSLAKYDRSKLRVVLEQMIERIESIPGVRSTSISCCGNNGLGFTDKVSGRSTGAQILWVGDNFFETLGVPLLFGRGFNPSDSQGGKQVVIVNEAFVHAIYPDVNPLGKQANGEIVGVVRDSNIGALRRRPAPAIYWSYRQGGFGRMTFRIRTTADPAYLVPEIRQSVMEVESHLPVSNVRTLAEQIDRDLAQENMFAGLSTLFGLLALVLTCIGFYGIMAYSVARRTNEIGVRMALGAKSADVLKLVMGEGLVLVMIGIGLGIVGALAAARYIESILFGLAPDDGLTIVMAVFIMLAVAALAAFIPARRAAGVDPLIALRYE